MPLRVLRDAELEAAEAAAWYEDRQVGLGDEFLLEVAESIGQVSSEPQSFSRLESYRGRHDVRRCVLRRFPYLVVFAMPS